MTLDRRRFTTAVVRLTATALVACALAGPGRSAKSRGGSDDAYRKAIEEWHQKRIERLTSNDGYLTFVGLFPLEEGTNRFGSAENNQIVFPAKAPKRAGTIYLKNGKLEIAAMPGVEIRCDGKPVDKIPVVSDAEGPPSQFEMGSLRFHVIERAGELYLRVRDSDNAIRKSFHGIERFPVDPKWRIEARFEPYDPPKPLKVPNVLGYEFDTQCPGAIVFELDGQTCRLEPMATEGDEFFIVFRDETSGLETYGGGRFLYAHVPDDSGKMVLDFNKSYNPPCAFTPFATCPLPHKANILEVRIEAGEKAYADSHR